ncbi:tetratricopeptide repeat protein [Pseudidiomarina gelatinasegens]|jgi:predicted Zn-dependent protease|uniref:Tetratricopeptide repeat protein n=1 Tax=Pseudidiomarina gelatinasegens TaxID=2487740 RepID=A0A443YXM3_9GAMM|nr:tetratricopeptide repeat protein [Pseudidiomarina gelatinasegens]RWU08758.1 tetratricopeptide repeat protein [Pseudidiomarina gelatinasegens]|tara:strand:- start:5191 stop:5688 length:498 start_codon:yes stop_codon:yes gene_type:complete
MKIVKLCVLAVLPSVVIGSGCAATEKTTFNTLEQQRAIASKSYQQGDLHVAEGYLQRIVSSLPKDSASWCKLGHINYRLNRYSAATNAYERCLSLTPELPEIWHNLAAVKLREATEFLLTGRAYIPELNEAGSASSFAVNYTRLLNELGRLHGVAGYSTEMISDD